MTTKPHYRFLSTAVRTANTAAIRESAAEMPLAEAQISRSRRQLLAALAAAPLAPLSMAGSGHVGIPAGARMEFAPLQRTEEGRRLSRVRYHNAEGFFAPIERGFPFRQSDQLYQVGIVLQLALSSHLLDIGFADAWCARNIGLYLNKSLECANATGLGHDCSELRRLADFLSPYGRWRNAGVTATVDACPFSHERMCRLTRDLLKRVREVTGHPRRRGQGARNE